MDEVDRRNLKYVERRVDGDGLIYEWGDGAWNMNNEEW